jgi:hypothetical protein
VRRPDAFARWVLSFGGDAAVEHPASLRDAVAALCRQTLAVYTPAGSEADDTALQHTGGG